MSGTSVLNGSRIAILLAVAVVWPLAASAAPTLSIQQRIDAARITLAWPDTVQVSQEVNGTELYLRFDRPLGDIELERLQTSLPEWIASVQYGRSSLLLGGTLGVKYTVMHSGRLVEIVMEREALTPEEESADEENPQTAEAFRLDYLRALTLRQSGDLEGAQRMLVGLLDQNGDNLEAMLLLAETEERLGRWRSADSLYDRALAVNPDQPDVARTWARLRSEHGSRVIADSSWREVKNADSQFISKFAGRLVSRGPLTVAATVQARRVTIDQLLRPDGQITGFAGTRSFAEVSASWNWSYRRKSWVDVYLNPFQPGVGIGHRLEMLDAAVRADLEYHRSYTDLVEGIVDGGTRDRLSVAYHRRLGERWSTQVGLSGNRYGLHDEQNVARTVRLVGAMEYMARTSEPTVVVAYYLDWESVKSQKQRTSSLGFDYSPLPLVSRQVHALSVGVTHALSPILLCGGSLGYSYDPHHGEGVLGELQATLQPGLQWEFVLRTSIGVESERGNSGRVHETSAALQRCF